MTANASSRHCWTVRGPAWRCQPAKSVPSYSMTSRRVRAGMKRVPPPRSELEHKAGGPGGVADPQGALLAETVGLVFQPLDEDVRVVDADVRVERALRA